LAASKKRFFASEKLILTPQFDSARMQTEALKGESRFEQDRKKWWPRDAKIDDETFA
jgi:hypothetical protein